MIKLASLLTQVKTLRLMRNMRVQLAAGDEAETLRSYADFLLRIGNGTEPMVTCKERDDYVNVPDEMVAENMDELVDFVLPSLVRSLTPSSSDHFPIIFTAMYVP